MASSVTDARTPVAGIPSVGVLAVGTAGIATSGVALTLFGALCRSPLTWLRVALVTVAACRWALLLAAAALRGPDAGRGLAVEVEAVELAAGQLTDGALDGAEIAALLRRGEGQGNA